MDLIEKKRSASSKRRAQQSQQIIFCLADYSTGCALETWWMDETAGSYDGRYSFRHYGDSHHVSDGCSVVHSRGAFPYRSNGFRNMTAGGVCLYPLNWGGDWSGRQLMVCLGWCRIWRRGTMGAWLGKRYLH